MNYKSFIRFPRNAQTGIDLVPCAFWWDDNGLLNEVLFDKSSIILLNLTRIQLVHKCTIISIIQNQPIKTLRILFTYYKST